MKNGTNDDDYEVAKISVSTGTTGGGEPSGSDDDPADKETFLEDVNFDINYQQNGRVTGTATNSEGRGKRSGRQRSSPTTDMRRRHFRSRHRKQLGRRVK